MRVSNSVGALPSPALDPRDIRTSQVELNRAREVLEAEAKRWRVEAKELQARLYREEQKGESELQGAKREISRLQSLRDGVDDRLRERDTTINSLHAESRETLICMAAVTSNLDQQVQLNANLQTRLRRSEAQTELMRCELREIFRSELDRTERFAASEAFLAGVMPGMKEEMANEASQRHVLQEDVELRRMRYELAERRLRTELRDVQAAAQRTAVESANYGRRATMTFESMRHYEGATRFWEQRAEVAERELSRIGSESGAFWQSMTQDRLMLRKQEAMMREIEAERDAARKQEYAAEDRADDLRSWVLNSMDEVNRNAHAWGGEPFAPGLHGGFKDRGWVAMLESFRQREQTRTGFGCRTRPAR